SCLRKALRLNRHIVLLTPLWLFSLACTAKSYIKTEVPDSIPEWSTETWKIPAIMSRLFKFLATAGLIFLLVEGSLCMRRRKKPVSDFCESKEECADSQCCSVGKYTV
ncbi:unnamed protein product, partial [Allacma fusca]